VAISLGFKNFDPQTTDRKPLIKKIVRRTIILFILGLFVNLLYTEFSAFRILGVLQRIAIVYFVCTIMALYLTYRQMIYASVFILVSYWLLILFVPAPGLEVGLLLRGENIINWFDSRFLPGMLWRGSWDPEGLLSTYPSIVSGLLGLFAGKIIIRSKDLTSTVMHLFVFGFLCFLAGYIWGFFFPFIKQVWTSTYVLVTGGIAFMTLAALLWYTDIKGSRKGTYVNMVFGTNAIVAYVLHVAVEKLLDHDFAGFSIRSAYVNFMGSIGINAIVSATLWVFLFVAVCFVPIWYMYRRKIFVKI
jgi:predicted acyltransferase